MSQGATVFSFDIALSDVDRAVYEQLSLKVAQHRSESAPYLVARVLAYCLELREGIAFSHGLASADDPAVWVRDLTGALQHWIEVGTPGAARLHKASKRADEVAVYCHKAPDAWLASLAGERVHEAARIRMYALDRALIQPLAEGLQRRNAWALTRVDGTLYLEGEDGVALSTGLTALAWPR